MPLYLLLLLLLALFLFLRQIVSYFTSPLRHLPGPLWTNSSLLAGVAFARAAMKGTRHKFQHEISRYGKVARLNPNTALVTDPEIVKAALAPNGWMKDPNVYRADRDGTRSLFSHVDPEAHKVLRRKLSPAFSVKALNDTEPIVLAVVEDFLARLGNMASSGASADFLHIYSLFTGDVIGQVAFGDKWGLVTRGHSEVLEHSEKMVRTAMVSAALGRLTPFFARYLKFIRDGLDSAKWMDNYAMNVVTSRRTGKTPRREDLLQIMCDTIDPQTNEKLTDKEVANNAVLFIAAGDETTAHQLSFVTYHLLSHPRVLQKLRAELDEASSHLPPDALLPHAILKDLPFLNAVLLESLRLLPTTYGVTRRVTPPEGWVHPSDSSLDLPGGVGISVMNGVLSRDPSVFPDPDEFIPERWDGIKESDVKYSYLPFSRGPRNCIGSSLALMEMRVLIANVFRRFDVNLVDEGLREGKRELETTLFLTMAPKKGELEARVRRRGI